MLVPTLEIAFDLKIPLTRRRTVHDSWPCSRLFLAKFRRLLLSQARPSSALPQRTEVTESTVELRERIGCLKHLPEDEFALRIYDLSRDFGL